MKNPESLQFEAETRPSENIAESKTRPLYIVFWRAKPTSSTATLLSNRDGGAENVQRLGSADSSGGGEGDINCSCQRLVDPLQ